ncbi:hypothetical protein FA13DRAFT_699542 [Coprinellus micaceus]|uniref:Uncharacterized protein n=1 Tax=Coprinellus micaceus TaxID=71717 RepID=A0A4Y7S9I4_COPMI|nr:hypothetical protein FA13DRAFT_699542 [Coprinellus micaceus]
MSFPSTVSTQPLYIFYLSFDCLLLRFNFSTVLGRTLYLAFFWNLGLLLSYHFTDILGHCTCPSIIGSVQSP